MIIPVYPNNVIMCRSDISEDYTNLILNATALSCDIETTGLDWRIDKIGTCQLYIQGGPAIIVKMDEERPGNLIRLLSNTRVKKVFHHALFDLRFMVFNWNFEPNNVYCTKIASKLLDPQNSHEHSLKCLLKRYIDIEVDKKEQISDWITENLTESQIRYAINDVLFLMSLLKVLEQQLASKGLWHIALRCFDHIPTRVRLDILGYKDVFTY